MGKKITKEKELKKALGITNFNEMTKDKFKMFTSLLPNMDKELAMAAINQFPSYADASKCMFEQLVENYNAVMMSNTESQKQALCGYQMVIDSLGELLKKDYLTKEERDSITEKMILVADKMAEHDKENKRFLTDAMKGAATVIGGILVLGATILGASDKKK